MKALITFLFWGTITAYCLWQFAIWALPWLASPFIALFALLAIVSGAARSTAR